MELSQQIFYILEITGTVAFAVSGAMIAIERGLDVFGVVFLGMITAVGGGILRGVLIGVFPPMAFEHRIYVFTAAAVSILVFLIAYFARRTYFEKLKLIDGINNIFDAVGLGAFAVSGTRIGLQSGFGDNAFLCVFLGMLTAIGGGLLRDMMSRSVPVVLRKRIYAIAAILGSIAYYYLRQWGVRDTLSIFLTVGLVCLIRIMATVFEWDLPVAAPEPVVRNRK